MNPRSIQKPLRIAIDGRLQLNQGAGGIESVLIGLIQSLGQLDDGEEEYIIIAPSCHSEQWRPYIGPNQKIVPYPESKSQRIARAIPEVLRPLARKSRDVLSKKIATNDLPQDIRISNGFYESLGCDVIHFPSTQIEICALPMIYNIYDLQHLHFPQFFTPAAIAAREASYPLGCRLAQKIVVTAQWIKEDIVRQYGTNPEKIQVISWAPPTDHLSDHDDSQPDAARIKYKLPQPFAYYPAKTYFHKNHLRLLEALALLRDRNGHVIQLVCSGMHDFNGSAWPFIAKHLDNLKLHNQVTFLGLVPHQDLRSLYRLAEFVIVPSLFEAFSAPLGEAWTEGVPTACSDILSLREETGDASLRFNPESVESIAEALSRMSTDFLLRESLVTKGNLRLNQYDSAWDRTAMTYRALYRQTANRSLSENEQELLGLDSARALQERAALQL